ncbi:SAM-dependent methyltransferase [Nocardioides sp. ChNu-153]|uniref:class I SAM-dependent methyltransferase n=1 Tax=unclassified Nocardioides TaxID=2615069 RepID=UPI002406455C|nr:MULTISPECIES: SAM-dependent methyltransferase [unclassified Nocardioides]MDN7119938.1 SAM-dependent methyltransferase [Nocardioides sp. ChNu-153]
MTEPLLRVLARMRSYVLDPDVLVRAVASGRQKGTEPRWRRAELRYVDLKAGRHLQVTTYDATQAHTSNHPAGSVAAREAVDALLDEPFASWHVDTTTQQHQVRVTKRLEAVVHTTDREEEVEPERGHDRDKDRLLAPDDPVLCALGIADAQGRVKPSRQAKYRQVEEFCRLLDAAVGDALAKGHLRRPTAAEPLRIVDLGCGNAYLTFAAHRFLTHVRGLPVHLVGVDVKEQSREHNTGVAAALGVADEVEFVVGTIAAAQPPERPEVVLALHACDTATDEALARAVEWDASLVLAAPCCHHDVAAQLRKAPTPAPYQALTRHGILRERFADTLTDGLRASLLRLSGYRVEVVQFVESQHTPRNTLLRAVRTGSPVRGGGARKEYDELVATWSIRPRLAELLEAAGRR